MQNTDGQNGGYDITLSGESSAYFDDLQCGTLTIPRNSTPAVNASYGSTINVGNTLQSIGYDPTTRLGGFAIDDGSSMILWDTSNNRIDISPKILDIYPTQETIITGKLTMQNGPVNFTNSTVDFNTASTISFSSNLPTSTITPTTSTQLITKGYADGAYAAAGSGVSLSGNNTWTGTNQFNKGILPCTTLTTTNIQVGSLNMMENRQVGSVDNVGIGVDALKGDSDPTGYIYSTGSRNTAVGNFALMQQGSGNECTAIGFQAMQLTGLERIYGAGVSPYYCTAIGVNSQRVNLYGYSNISIGVNCLNNVGSGTGNIIIGNNGGNGLGNVGACVVIGDGAMPSAVDNGIVCIGAGALGAALNQCNSGTFVGSNAGLNNNNGQSNTFIGANAGTGNGNGSNNCCLGVYAGRLSPSSGNFVVCIGYDSFAVQSNEFVIGGNNFSDRGELTLPNKTRLACNQTQTAATLNLGFRENENVLLTSAATTVINLPTPLTTGENEGAKFYINRKVAGVNITINAPSGQTLALNQANGTYTTSASYTWSSGSNSITVLCIGSGAGGTNWQILPPGISQGSDSVLLNTTVPLPALNYSIPFGGQTTAGYQPQFMDNTNLKYQPSTSTLTTTTINSTNVTTSGALTVTSTGSFRIVNYRPYEIGSILNNATALPGAPTTLYGIYTFTSGTADAVILLPTITIEMTGCPMQFRRIANTSFQLIIKTGAGSGATIVQRNSNTITPQNTNYTLLSTSDFMAQLVPISTTQWMVIDSDVANNAVDLTTTQSITGTKNFNVLSATTYKYNEVSPMLVASGAVLSVTIANPPYSFYPFTMKTAHTIDVTLPEITSSNGLLGSQITFKRVGGSLQILRILANASLQAVFYNGNGVGTTATSAFISTVQGCGTLTAIETQGLGDGTFSNTAGATTVTIIAQGSGTLFIGGVVNFNGTIRTITAYGTGTGGTGTYTVNTAIAGANTLQQYLTFADTSYGWAMTQQQ